MTLFSRSWRDRAARAAGRARGAGWALLLGALGALLAAQALAARREAGETSRQGAALDAEIERARRANASLRDELRALEGDPVYVESLLRRWKRAGSGERIVE